MLPEPQVPPELIHALRECREKVREYERRCSLAGLRSLGVDKGQIVRDPDTGARYRVESVTIWIREDGTPQISIQGRRTYKTGRRDAWATTILCGRSFEVEI